MSVGRWSKSLRPQSDYTRMLIGSVLKLESKAELRVHHEATAMAPEPCST